MQATDRLYKNIESDLEHATEPTLPPLHHQWPLLGQELFVLEQILTAAPAAHGEPLTEQEKREQRETIRNTIIAQLYRDEGTYSRDTRHLAFLLLKQSRGGEIVGNPSVVGKDGRKQELPYTGLEGYYAGSERTADRPGMTREEIIQEEATIGAELLKSLKKRAIGENAWVHFAHLKHVLEGERPTLEELQTIQLSWSMVVRRLHVRIYHNPEFEMTLSERIEQVEQLFSGVADRTEEERRLKTNLQAERARLKQEHERMSEAEREQERQERRKRERVRADRVAEFRRFREETYQILTTSEQGRYNVGVRDASLEEATILETITLPTLPGRSTYPSTSLHLTPEQLEGYLFLVKLGEIGGDPLARSILVSR